MPTNIIDRSALAGLIPEPVSREIIQGVTAGSAVLQMGRRLPNMTSKTQAMNVLDMLPMAYWVDGDTGTKQTTKMAWDKKKIYAEELAVIVPIPEAVLDDADYDIWAEVRPRLVEAFGQKIDAAVLFGDDKPTSWRSSVVDTATAAGAVVTATVTDATLVSMFNSEAVADRLMAYYSSSKMLSAKIVVDGERPGDFVSFSDALGNQTSAFIQSMSIVGSTKLAAQCELVSGYSPPSVGTEFTHVKAITYWDKNFTDEGNVWVVPDDVHRIRLVLIGGGDGGWSGESGKNGKAGKRGTTEAEWGSIDDCGENGAGGKGGDGGKIYIVTVDVMPGQKIYWHTANADGGDGGFVGEDGSSSRDETFGIGTPAKASTRPFYQNGAYTDEYNHPQFSSDMGTSSPVGYTDPLTGNVYALPGADGTSGPSVANGAYGKPASMEYHLSDELVWYAIATGGTGGRGGGHGGIGGNWTWDKCAGKVGADGKDGLVEENVRKGLAEGGNGGAGGDGGDGPNGLSSIDGSTMGNGGQGGGGGGGGGSGGGAAHSLDPTSYAWVGSGGKGGKGGKGGYGAPGGILIYY